MYAIAFDLVVKDTQDYHPKGVQEAYTDIGAVLAKFGFVRTQGSLYTNMNEDMANLFQAMNALKQLAWISQSYEIFALFVLSNGLILLILYEINICLDKPYRLPCLIPFRQYNGGVLLTLIRYDYV